MGVSLCLVRFLTFLSAVGGNPVAFAKPTLHDLWGLLCAFCASKRSPLYIINIGIKPIFKDFAKKMKKIVEKVCTYRNYPYLCIRNQEISSYKTKKTVANRKMSNGFEKKLKKSCKKVLEKFGGYKKGYYLCNRFPPQIRAEFFKRFFDLLVI